MASKAYRHRAKRVSELLAAGLTLEQICASPHMPKVETVRLWLMNSPDFRRRYVRARRLRNERLIEEVLELADSLPETAGETEARRLRLRIDARKWAVARFSDPVFDATDDAEDLPPLTVIA